MILMLQETQCPSYNEKKHVQNTVYDTPMYTQKTIKSNQMLVVI